MNTRNTCQGCCLLIVMLLQTHLSFTQEKDLMDIRYTGSALTYDDTCRSAHLWEAKFKIPIVNKKPHTIVSTLGYKSLSLMNFPESYAVKLHGVTLQAAWLYKFSKRKSLTLFVQAGLFSDLNALNSSALRYSGGFRYRVKHSDKLTTGWGLGYSKQFFGNQVIPFIDIDYRPNDRWSVTGQFPIKPKILYHVSKKLRAGIEISGDAASYRLSARERNNGFIQLNQWTGLVKVEHQLSKSWQLHVGIGKNFKQSYKLYNDAAATPWTIITFPLGSKEVPVYEIGNKGMNAQIGIYFNPF